MKNQICFAANINIDIFNYLFKKRKINGLNNKMFKEKIEEWKRVGGPVESGTGYYYCYCYYCFC